MVHKIEILSRNPTINRMIPRMITTTPQGVASRSDVAQVILGALGGRTRTDTPRRVGSLTAGGKGLVTRSAAPSS